MSNAAKTEAPETTTVQSILNECSFSDGAEHPGYYFADFFAVSPHAQFQTREAAIAAMRAAYKGADSDGVGVILPEATETVTDGETELHEMAPKTSAAPALLLALPRRR